MASCGAQKIAVTMCFFFESITSNKRRENKNHITKFRLFHIDSETTGFMWHFIRHMNKKAFVGLTATGKTGNYA